MLVRLEDRNQGGATAGRYIQFYMPNIKLNSGNIGDAVSEGLPVEMQFESYRPGSDAEAGADYSQLVIQQND